MCTEFETDTAESGKRNLLTMADRLDFSFAATAEQHIISMEPANIHSN